MHQSDYIPSLDGVRGLAVILVILIHGSYGIIQGGWIGVDLFFVLSGYLITSLLIEEYRRTGQSLLAVFGWSRPPSPGAAEAHRGAGSARWVIGRRAPGHMGWDGRLRSTTGGWSWNPYRFTLYRNGSDSYGMSPGDGGGSREIARAWRGL